MLRNTGRHDGTERAQNGYYLKNIVQFCLGILRIQPELSICKSIYVITNDSNCHVP